MMNTALLAAILAISSLAASARANITVIIDQTEFLASGTIVQNTNFNASGGALSHPANPFTIGELTFVAGTAHVVGGIDDFAMVRSLLTDENLGGTTVQIAGKNNLFAFNAGNFFYASPGIIDIATNLDTYQFTPRISLYSNNGSLSFLGYRSGAGEYFTSVRYFSGGYAAGGTDFQIGIADAIPEPDIWGFMILGFGIVGAALRRHAAVTTKNSRRYHRPTAGGASRSQSTHCANTSAPTHNVLA